MKQYDKFYINGEWVSPIQAKMFDITNPANEETLGQVALGSKADVDKAVSAATQAFKTWSLTSREERLGYLDKIIEIYTGRLEEMAQVISSEMGAPMDLARTAQAPIGLTHFETSRKALESYVFEESIGGSHIYKEAIGVCGFITPWNWPMNQIACKVAPALACGCTMVLKPSELAPLSAQLFAEIIHESGLPPGVFNMVNGDGPEVGTALSSHPDIEMVSLTGSTRAGILVSKAAADTVKRVTLELGGKSANIILEDADFDKSVEAGALHCFSNTGQSCNAPTRMLVPRAQHDRAVEVAQAVAQATIPGDPQDKTTHIGPLSNKGQFSKVHAMIQRAIDEGSEIVAGGPGRPEGLTSGYYARPTVFANVTNDMLIAREEVFGPVLAILPYDDEEQAIQIANDTPYGLAGYIQSENIEHARQVAKKIRAGSVYLNGNNYDPNAPFGGYKQSGNGREWGSFAFDDFLEIKGVVGYSV
ncbi:MAG: aldehyde dehydrogenase family protein [Gammaproteobacteria bacterium]|nr:MAG: aldehyde dehydrogenase family protein [Gammaproteobacteria bacterium]